MDIQIARAKVDIVIEQYFETETKNAQAIDGSYGDLWRAMKQATLAGGKRLRPYLLLLGYSIVGGADFESILSVAAAQELLHQCLLIHDDIIDRDLIRHGELNVSGLMKQKYARYMSKPGHHSNGAAILAGDLLLSGAYQMVAHSSIKSDAKIKTITRMGEAVFRVGGGELLDSESVIRPLLETDVLKVAELKTASYSFVIPLVCGAELAQATAKEIAYLREFGESLGIAFQLRDDVAGMFGTKKETGKSTLSDIREGKHTLLLQYASIHASTKQQSILSGAVGNPRLTHALADKVKQIVIETGSLNEVEAVIKKFALRAEKAINKLQISPASHAELTALIVRVKSEQLIILKNKI
jgi:geranylgeranyl pyrophosphate synthase